ncbi:MAG: cytochrome c peroxidase [Flavobacteriales bacterium]
MKKIQLIIVVFAIGIFTTSCRKSGCTNPNAINYDSNAKVDDGSCVCTPASGPTPYQLQIPQTFSLYLPAPIIPVSNPMTVEGVALGKKLFFDKQLSGDNTLACAGCHFPTQAFDDTNRFSIGIDGIRGDRNAMPIFNHAWNTGEKFFWDGRANTLEVQAFEPVLNPIEMHDTWPNVVSKLQADESYPAMYLAAFSTSTIDSVLTSKALAQYERTLISGNSRFDKYLLRQINLTSSELNGFGLFMDESGADCFHCHGDATNPLWTDNLFHNNGLDASFTDNGLGDITGSPSDNGKFKTPSLRNLAYTAPYMHDGRFKTLDEVIDHYSDSLVYSSTISPLLKHIPAGGVNLTIQEKGDLKAFLLTLTDSSFVTGH